MLFYITIFNLISIVAEEFRQSFHLPNFPW